MQKGRILIIEDEEDILEIIKYNLENAGYIVSYALDGKKGLALIFEIMPDLVILDLMLPHIDGIEICEKVRSKEETKNLPIIMLTAKSEEEDIINGLEKGADDYISKPFSPKELLARVKSILRRNKIKSDEKKKLIFGDLIIDMDSFETKIRGKNINLTSSEQKIIYNLASYPGIVFSRDKIISSLGDDSFIIDRNIDVHIMSIRKKLGEKRDHIETKRGIGYLFKKEIA